MAETKKYRRPDGSTYRQIGGPKSARDVEVTSGGGAAAREKLKGMRNISASEAGDAVAKSGEKKRQPWDEPLSDRPVGVTPHKAAPVAETPETPADALEDQAESFARRNREIARRTRHLRKD